MKIKGLLLKSFFVLALLAELSLFPTRQCYGAFYKYINHKGIECFTDSLGSVPAEFRNKAVRIEADEEIKVGPKSGKAAPKETGAAAGESQEAKGTTEVIAEFFRHITDNRLYMAGIAIAVVIIATIVVKKIGESVGSRNFSILMRIVFSVALLLYIYDLYSKEIVDIYGGVMKSVTGVRGMEENRDRKLNATVNEMFPEKK